MIIEGRIIKNAIKKRQYEKSRKWFIIINEWGYYKAIRGNYIIQKSTLIDIYRAIDKL